MDYLSQIFKYKKMGLKNVNISYLYDFFKEVSYIRFNKYCNVYLKRNINRFEEGITMEKMINVYKFDCAMRNNINKVIDYIEIVFKSQIINHFENNDYSSNFINSDYFENLYFYEEMINIFNECRKKNNIKDFYQIIEYSSIGTLSRMYSNLKKKYKRNISNNEIYDINNIYFTNYLYVLTEMRNRCSHRDVLYGNILTSIPKLSSVEARLLNVDYMKFKCKLFHYIFVIIKLIPNDNLKKSFIKDLKFTINKYGKYIDFDIIGFPNNWELLLLKSS